MWAVAAQPRTGLTPMIPTPSIVSCISNALVPCASPTLRAARSSSGCPDGGAPLAGVDHFPVQSSELVEVARRLDAKGGVHSARLHRLEPGCCDEPLDRGGSLV